MLQLQATPCLTAMLDQEGDPMCLTLAANKVQSARLAVPARLDNAGAARCMRFKSKTSAKRTMIVCHMCAMSVAQKIASIRLATSAAAACHKSFAAAAVVLPGAPRGGLLAPRPNTHACITQTRNQRHSQACIGTATQQAGRQAIGAASPWIAVHSHGYQALEP
jgi:hypothetical protein